MAEAPAASTANPLGNTHEARLLEDMKQLDVGMRNKGAIRLHLSRLLPETRTVQNLRSAEVAFEDLTKTRAAWLYRLRNSDLMVIFERDQTDLAERAVLKLLKLWERDPLMQKFKTDARKNRLTSWFDLETDYDKLLAFAHRQAASSDTARSKSLQQLIVEREHRVTDPERGQPLTPLELSKVEDSLVRVDLSSFTRRQAVCAFVEDGKAELVFTELFVSIADLRETLMPRTDMTANPWLFQRLTQTLDRRVMAQIARREDKTLLREAFSINLNVQTLLSEEFIAFDEDFAPTNNDVILEMRLEDIFSDPESFTFARDFVIERGYRLCVDGLTLQTFRYADPDRLGVHYMKLMWTRDLAGWIGTTVGQEMKAMIRERKRGRTILARCDSEAAIQVGRQLGITLFQGRYIDSLVRGR
ncbi:MAG: EAL domain-containing protein [Rhodospirillaceae bacterium]|nr:MAG: EAL domain-containing protein [Rhodospirillaceae bacterium]